MVDNRALLVLGVLLILSIASILALRGGGGTSKKLEINEPGGGEKDDGNVSGSSSAGTEPGNTELATLGGGCFWCIEAVFEQVKGVVDVRPGYSGGSPEDATYQRVCSGSTDHAEVVQIEFDPEVIAYWEILDIFFNVHDPTTINRQGADVGPQYRSVVFYHDEEQRKTALEIIDQVNDLNIYSHPVVTQVVPYEAFYPAEKYHEDYYENNPNQPYCRLIIAPKVSKLRKYYEEKLKEGG